MGAAVTLLIVVSKCDLLLGFSLYLPNNQMDRWILKKQLNSDWLKVYIQIQQYFLNLEAAI